MDASRSRQLTDKICARFGAGRAQTITDMVAALAAADGMINATPIGMEGHPGLPLPLELLRGDLWVAEVVYFPLHTALLQAARARGCATLNGGGMAVLQAAEAFRLFSGMPADAERMFRHFASMDESSS